MGAAVGTVRTDRKYRLRWWTLGALALSLVIIGLDNTILNVAIPTVQRHFGASASELQWMIDAYILVFAGLLLTMGSLGDRFGRKRALQAGIVVFVGASMAAAYSETAGQLIAARAVMGVGGALIMPSTLSVLVDVFPREERARAIGVWAGMAALGIVIGPTLGGWLLEHYWWGSVFLINLPVGVTALVLGLVLVPESRDPMAHRTDFLGAVLSIVGLTTLVFAIIEAPARGWTDGLVLGGFAGAVMLLVLFIAWELRTADPMLNMRFFRNPRFSGGAAAIALTFLALFGCIFLFTQYLQFVRGYSPFEAGVRMLPIAVGMMIGAGNSHRLIARLGTKRVVAMGLSIVTTVLLVTSFLDAETPYWVLGVGMAIFAFGLANTMAPATDAVMGAVPEANAGVGAAMNDTTRMVGGALGVAVLGAALNSSYTASMAGAVAGLPGPAAAAAGNSVGAAMQIAAQIGGPAGEALRLAASQAFVEGLAIAVLMGAGITALGIAVVLRFLPAHDV